MKQENLPNNSTSMEIVPRRRRGIPEDDSGNHFCNLIKGLFAVGGAIVAVKHPEIGPVTALATEVITRLQSAFAKQQSEEITEHVIDDLYRAWNHHRLTDEQLQQVMSSVQFHAALLQARQIATRTAQEEKLAALRNAVLNVAIGVESNEERQAIFLSLVDRFEPAHLRVLRTFQNPPATGGYIQWQTSITIQNPGTPTRWIREFVPGFENDDTNFIRMLITDLYNAGLSLITPGAQNVPVDTRWITGLGSSFLKFISEPAK